MNYFLISMLSIILLSCNTTSLSFEEKVVDFAIKNKNNTFIEISNYDTLCTQISEDKDEQLHLVQILKHKGFKIMHYGRGNHTLGPRIIDVDLQKDNCKCKVQKLYYNTISETDFECREKIKCYE